MPKMLEATVKNFFRKRATRNYPFVVRELPERVRGELYNEIEKCIFCGRCAKVCPSQCITVDKDKGTWFCDPFACVYCGICEDNCPVTCLHHYKKYRSPTSEREVILLQGEPPKKKKAAAKAQKAE